MNTYQQVRDFIFFKLKQIDVGDIDISAEIENAKSLSSIPEVSLKVFGNERIQLSDADWESMKSELETRLNVKMKQGILITGDKEQDRDRTWWTGKHREESDCYYWNRYREYLEDSLPRGVVRTINTDTDIVMNSLENPSINMFDRRGMVVGHVQSGKTGNYTGLICKAADAGYKFIVVIAGGMNNLRNQTQERLNEGFVGKDGGKPVGVGSENAQNDKLPISLTTKEQDFNTRDADRNAQSTNFDNTKNPVVLVIKKNTNSLRNVIDWLDRQYSNKVESHAMLMIDDESDYASIDTSKPENEPTAINKGLRKILAKFSKSVYVAYTATPYANIFIDHEAGHEQYEDDLFPRDFIYALNEPDNYFGARKIFLDPERKHLKTIDDYQDVIPIKHKKDIELPSVPDSLYEAIRVFLLNVAIRNLRADQVGKHNSMLIHATRFTATHQKIANHVEQYLTQAKEDVSVLGGLPNANQQSRIIQNLESTFYETYKDLEFSWSEVLKSLHSTISSVMVREVHQQTTIPLEYRKDVVTNAIVVGGTSLSRGYTLEGLSVSYFLRSTIFYDTLMQMGRWFGYREGYQDLCRIYLTESMIDNFGHIIESTEDLINDLRKMSSEGLTPKDFGLAVRAHPDSILQVTARNKQRNVTDFVHSICLDGKSKETSWLSINSEYRDDNLAAIRGMVHRLQDDYRSTEKKVGKHYLWREVEKQHAIDFLTEFKVYQNDSLGISSRMPIDFVKKYAHDVDTKWDVAIYSGEGEKEVITNVEFYRERRKVTVVGDCISVQNRQVSSGSAESIALDEEVKKRLKSSSGRREARENLERPLLMLHILEARDSKTEEIVDKNLAAFGVSFPSKISSNMQNVSLRINTVYQQQLLDLWDDEESDD